MNLNVARVLVVIKALPTHLVAISTAVVWIAPEITKVFPEHAETIASSALRVIAALAAAVTIIRKVTPVAPEQVGLLLQPPPASPIVKIDKPPGMPTEPLPEGETPPSEITVDPTPPSE